MSDNYVQVPPNSTGLKVDTSELTVGANTVERQRMVIGDDAGASSLATVNNTAPSETSYGLTVRTQPRKFSEVLSTTTLGSNGVFTGSWNNSQAGSTVFVAVQCFADQASASNGLVIQESDDTSNANLTRTVAQASVSASTLSVLYATIRAKNWRVNYTNGSSAQGAFELTETNSVAHMVSVDSTGATVLGTGAATVGAVNLAQYTPATGRLPVDGSGVTQPVSGTFWQATQPVSIASLPALTTGSAVIGHVIVDTAPTTAVTGTFWQATQPVSGTVTAGQGTAASLSGKWPVQITDGTNTMPTGDASARTIHTTVDNSSLAVTGTFWQGTQPVSIASMPSTPVTGTFWQGTQPISGAVSQTGGPWTVTQNPATSGGLSYLAGSIGATKTAIKASAGQIYGWYFYNANASVAYVQIFNLGTGSVTLGTTAPDLAFGIPASSGANVEISNGIAFSTAITIAVTTTRTGSTGPGSTVDYNIFYK